MDFCSPQMPQCVTLCTCGCLCHSCTAILQCLLMHVCLCQFSSLMGKPESCVVLLGETCFLDDDVVELPEKQGG